MQINRFQTKERALHEAREKLSSVLKNYSDNNSQILLLLSGGSATDIIRNFDWQNINDITVTTLDERYTRDENNNYISLKKFLPDFIKTIPSIPKENESLETFAERLNNNLYNWIKENKKGKIVTTMGIGPDSHTSGILPISDKETEKIMNDTERFIVGYKTEKSEHKMRATTNFTFLKIIDNAIVFLSDGDKKSKAWNNVISKKGNLNETPARIINEIKGEVFVFMDF